MQRGAVAVIIGPSALLLIGFLTFIGGVCAIYYVQTTVTKKNGP